MSHHCHSCACDQIVADTVAYRIGRLGGLLDMLELVESDLRDHGILLRTHIVRSVLSSGATVDEALANLDRLYELCRRVEARVGGDE